jgi:microcystin-dependent protein
MPKNKVSEWSATASNNTDIGGINIAEGCAPSGINNAIRELMAQVKDMQSGTDADNFTVGGNLTVTGTATGATPSASDDSTKFATTAFVRDIIPTGVIVMWSGTIATIPTGWFLCDGSNSTPDLRNRFIIAANADDGGAAKTNVTGSATQTGGSKDAIVVSHTHSVTDPGHLHTVEAALNFVGGAGANGIRPTGTTSPDWINTATTGISIDSTGSSGTNANLVPYYALAFIMKS